MNRLSRSVSVVRMRTPSRMYTHPVFGPLISIHSPSVQLVTQIHRFSTSANGENKKEGMVRMVWRTMNMYSKGVKSLYHRFQEMRRLLALDRPLSRKEAVLVYKTKTELQESLPVIAVFCLPFVGYAVPILGLFFPKYLPQSFWSPKQRVCATMHCDMIALVCSFIHGCLCEHVCLFICLL